MTVAAITLYTDGACKGNPGRGGWGCIALGAEAGELWRLSGQEEYTTNNRMELMGPIAGLDEVMRRGWRGEDVHVKTDSTYVANGITKWIGAWVKNGWVTKTGEPVKNAELWRRLLAHQRVMGGKLKWSWVKGHGSDAWNNAVDKLASDAAASVRRTGHAPATVAPVPSSALLSQPCVARRQMKLTMFIKNDGK